MARGEDPLELELESFIQSPPSSERSRLFCRSGRLLAVGALHATGKDKAPRERSTQTTPSRNLTLGVMQSRRSRNSSPARELTSLLSNGRLDPAVLSAPPWTAAKASGPIGGRPLEADGGRVLHKSAQGSGIKTIFYFFILNYGTTFFCRVQGRDPDPVLIYKSKKLSKNNKWFQFSKSCPWVAVKVNEEDVAPSNAQLHDLFHLDIMLSLSLFQAQTL